MKRITALLFASILLLTLTACNDKSSGIEPATTPVPEENIYISPTLILNGEVLDVYTLHYDVTEEYAVLPLNAFLLSIGANFARSTLNEYGIQCYSFKGNRYIVASDMHLFMLEDDYISLLNKLDDEGKELSRETSTDYGLLPKSESKVSLNTNGTIFYSSEIWVDHISLMNALTESGIDITIESDYSNKIISVTLP